MPLDAPLFTCQASPTALRAWHFGRKRQRRMGRLSEAVGMKTLTPSRVIVVDERDRAIGSGQKLSVHRAGELHRAVSVFVVSPGRSQLLLQRRAEDKYHSGGLWSNTACSHPAPGEGVAEAASRCLLSEMGLSLRLRPLHVFRYRADVGDGLVENEMDHLYWGVTTDTPKPMPDEVAEWRWEDTEVLLRQVQTNPDQFTAWFRLCCESTLQAIHEAVRGLEGDQHVDEEVSAPAPTLRRV